MKEQIMKQIDGTNQTRPAPSLFAGLIAQLDGNTPFTPNETEEKMRDLNYELKQMCARNRDGSYATQADRERMLALLADQLTELGFRHMRADSLKPKHIGALVGLWKEQGLGACRT
jgi:hypothetical protein